MKVAQLLVAAALAIPAVSSFAQSTPISMNDDVSAQIAQEQPTYRRTSVPPRVAQLNMGRYSLSVTRPSF
jgi:hypothetical protein